MWQNMSVCPLRSENVSHQSKAPIEMTFSAPLETEITTQCLFKIYVTIKWKNGIINTHSCITPYTYGTPILTAIFHMNMGRHHQPSEVSTDHPPAGSLRSRRWCGALFLICHMYTCQWLQRFTFCGRMCIFVRLDAMYQWYSPVIN